MLTANHIWFTSNVYICGKCTRYANQWASCAKNETGAMSITFAWEQTPFNLRTKRGTESWCWSLILKFQKLVFCNFYSMLLVCKKPVEDLGGVELGASRLGCLERVPQTGTEDSKWLLHRLLIYSFMPFAERSIHTFLMQRSHQSSLLSSLQSSFIVIFFNQNAEQRWYNKRTER